MQTRRIAFVAALALFVAARGYGQATAAGPDPGSPAASEPGGAVAAPAADSTTGARPVWRGYVGLEGRTFNDAPALSGQARNGFSFVAQPELGYQSASRRHRLDVALFGRFSLEPTYGSLDARELAWRYHGDGWSMLAGMNRVFWGATESRHVVDVVNQSDMRESFVGDVKLGQLMVSAALERPWGQLELYVLPGFRTRAFPRSGDRPRLQLPVAHATVESGGAPDWAARASLSRGDVDLHASYFRGVSREPDLVAILSASGQPTGLQPHYREMGQIGVDVQVARGAWLFKGELMHRTKPGTQYAAGAGGVEYGIGRLFGGAGDLALLAEYQFDNRPTSEWPAPATRGIYSGLRFARNDRASTELKAGTVYDVPSHSWLLRAEFNRRLTNHWALYLGGYGFTHVRASPALRDFSRDSHLTLTLRRYL